MKPDSAIGAGSVRTAPAEWVRSPERGSRTLLRVRAAASHLLGRAPSRVLLHLIASYFVLFAPTARRHARNYLRRALAREPRFTDRYRHVLTFASTIHDRVYLLDKCFDQFAFSIEGEELMRAMV